MWVFSLKVIIILISSFIFYVLLINFPKKKVNLTCFSPPFQRRTKQKVVTDFSTVSKGASAAAKPRAALRQVLFSQSEKNPATEVPLPPLSLKSVSDNHTNTPDIHLYPPAPFRIEASWTCWSRIWEPMQCQPTWSGSGKRKIRGRSWKRAGPTSWILIQYALHKLRVIVVFNWLFIPWITAVYLLVRFSDNVKDAEAPAGGAVGVCPHRARLHQQANCH